MDLPCTFAQPISLQREGEIVDILVLRKNVKKSCLHLYRADFHICDCALPLSGDWMHGISGQMNLMSSRTDERFQKMGEPKKKTTPLSHIPGWDNVVSVANSTLDDDVTGFGDVTHVQLPVCNRIDVSCSFDSLYPTEHSSGTDKFVCEKQKQFFTI